MGCVLTWDYGIDRSQNVVYELIGKKDIFDKNRKKRGSEFGLFTKLESQCSAKCIMRLKSANGERQGAFTLVITHTFRYFSRLHLFNLRFK